MYIFHISKKIVLWVYCVFHKKVPEGQPTDKPSGDSSKTNQKKYKYSIYRDFICSPVAGLPRLHSLSIFLSQNAPNMTAAIRVMMPSVIKPFCVFDSFAGTSLITS